MDFETRQRLAVDEVNAILQKYNVALQPFLDAKLTGILPQVRLIDVESKVDQIQETNDDKKTKRKK